MTSALSVIICELSSCMGAAGARERDVVLPPQGDAKQISRVSRAHRYLLASTDGGASEDPSEWRPEESPT